MVNQYRLHRRKSGYFYHRTKVPADIRELYGKQIEQRSLHTRDFRDAIRRLPAVIVAVDEAFAQFRTDHRDDLASVALNSPSGARGKPARYGCWFSRGTEPVFPPRSEPPLSMVF
ncbi:DUF6538 domain-containing protein [Neorhizobium galegae]|uniref:DUF6538 domain-containing protein n=1 Tax=Neorhizobium galegae TaxID=399 RepID=UPI00349EC32A